MRRQLAVLVAALVVTLPLVTPRIYASDEIQYVSYLRSLWFDRDVSFENEYQHFWDAGIARGQGFHETHLERQTDTGKRISFATLGTAVLWSPDVSTVDVVTTWRPAAPVVFSRAAASHTALEISPSCLPPLPSEIGNALRCPLQSSERNSA